MFFQFLEQVSTARLVCLVARERFAKALFFIECIFQFRELTRVLVSSLGQNVKMEGYVQELYELDVA